MRGFVRELEGLLGTDKKTAKRDTSMKAPTLPVAKASTGPTKWKVAAAALVSNKVKSGSGQINPLEGKFEEF